MSLAAPIWGWALAGLAVPLAIHLFSRGRRQRVALGSVRHLAGSESRALRRVKVSGWQQLLLRLILLAVLALALSGPRWPQGEPGAANANWVFVDPELLSLTADTGTMEDEFVRLLEEAKKEAGSVRLLADGLPEWRGSELLSASADAWSLLREADEIAPPGVSFSVFTFDRAAWLRGRRPALARSVDWQVLEDSKPNRWIQRAVSATDNVRRVTIGESTSRATRFEALSWSAHGPPPEETGMRIDPDGNVLELVAADRFPEDQIVPIPRASEPIRIALTSGPDRATDAWYLRRAMAAVGEFLGRELVWANDGGSSADLAIDLGGSSTAQSASRLVLADGDSPYESCQGWVDAGSVSGDPWIRLERCSTRWEPDDGVPWWVDSWGRPFLSRQTSSQVSIYELEGRFDARWSSLVTSPILPHLLLELLAPTNSRTGGIVTSASDRRSTTGLERMPRATVPSAGAAVEESALPELVSWLTVIVLLVAERRLAGRTP